MDRRTYGSKYNENLGTKQIAALVRAEIKAAVKSGALPSLKASVTMERFAGGSSITIRLSDVAIKSVYNPVRLRADVERPNEPCSVPWITDEARALLDRVEAILGAYNHDGSDSMTDHFDVKFYAHVEFDHAWQSGRRAAEIARLNDPAPAKSIEERAAKFAPIIAAAFPAAPAPSNVVAISTRMERCKPYRVRTSCGHEVIRQMREETARIAWTPDVVIDAPNGRPCPMCEEAANAPKHVIDPSMFDNLG